MPADTLLMIVMLSALTDKSPTEKDKDFIIYLQIYIYNFSIYIYHFVMSPIMCDPIVSTESHRWTAMNVKFKANSKHVPIDSFQ